MDAIGAVSVYPCFCGSLLCHWRSQESHFVILFPIYIPKNEQSLGYTAKYAKNSSDGQQVAGDGLFWPSAFDWKGIGNKKTEAELLWVVFGSWRRLLWKVRKKWLLLWVEEEAFQLLNGSLSASGTYWRRWMLGVRCQGRVGSEEPERKCCWKFWRRLGPLQK